MGVCRSRCLCLEHTQVAEAAPHSRVHSRLWPPSPFGCFEVVIAASLTVAETRCLQSPRANSIRLSWHDATASRVRVRGRSDAAVTMGRQMDVWTDGWGRMAIPRAGGLDTIDTALVLRWVE